MMAVIYLKGRRFSFCRSSGASLWWCRPLPGNMNGLWHQPMRWGERLEWCSLTGRKIWNVRVIHSHWCLLLFTIPAFYLCSSICIIRSWRILWCTDIIGQTCIAFYIYTVYTLYCRYIYCAYIPVYKYSIYTVYIYLYLKFKCVFTNSLPSLPRSLNLRNTAMQTRLLRLIDL